MDSEDGSLQDDGASAEEAEPALPFQDIAKNRALKKRWPGAGPALPLDDELNSSEDERFGVDLQKFPNGLEGLFVKDAILSQMASGAVSLPAVVVANCNRPKRSLVELKELPPTAFADHDFNRQLLEANLILDAKPWGMPWERNEAVSSYGMPSAKLRKQFFRLELASTETWLASTVDELKEKRATTRKNPMFPRAVKRLKDIKTEDYKDTVRARAMNRWYLILFCCANA